MTTKSFSNVHWGSCWVDAFVDRMQGGAFTVAARTAHIVAFVVVDKLVFVIFPPCSESEFSACSVFPTGGKTNAGVPCSSLLGLAGVLVHILASTPLPMMMDVDLTAAKYPSNFTAPVVSSCVHAVRCNGIAIVVVEPSCLLCGVLYRRCWPRPASPWPPTATGAA